MDGKICTDATGTAAGDGGRRRADWDALAEGYPLTTDRPSTLFALETMRRALGRLTTVADIGCGPGNESIPFAAAFERVYSVDSSPAMLERLRAECAARGIGNVHPVLSDCLEVELPERCQVAFSCLCPGMFSTEGLETLERLSHDMCVFVSHYFPKDCAERRLVEEMGLPAAEAYDTALLLERHLGGRDVGTATFSDRRDYGIDDAVRRAAFLCAGGEEDRRQLKERVRGISIEGFPNRDNVMVLYWRKGAERRRLRQGAGGARPPFHC